MNERAIAKLNEEMKELKGLGHKELIIAPSVVKTLISFCGNEDFAEAVLQEDKTLKECLKSIIEGSKDCISDLYAYQKSATYYFPNASIAFKMIMTIDEMTTVSSHDGQQEKPLEREKPEPKAKTVKAKGSKTKAVISGNGGKSIIEPSTIPTLQEKVTTVLAKLPKKSKQKIIQLDIFGNEVMM